MITVIIFRQQVLAVITLKFDGIKNTIFRNEAFLLIMTRLRIAQHYVAFTDIVYDRHN